MADDSTHYHLEYEDIPEISLKYEIRMKNGRLNNQFLLSGLTDAAI